MSEQKSYNLQAILLLESEFTRTWTIDFENPEFSNNVDINVEDARQENFLNVIVILSFKAGVKDDIQINARIKMVGVFSTPTSPDLDIDQFASVNAPAIIFPFLREHLSSLSVKAGISPILLAPVNFVQHSALKKQTI